MFFSVSSLTANYYSAMVVSFVPTWHKPESFRKREPQLRSAFTRLTYGKSCCLFSWFMTNVRGPSSLWVVPALGWWSSCYKIAGQGCQYGQTSQQHFSVAFPHVFASNSFLSSFPDFHRWWTVSCNMKSALLSQDTFYYVVLSQR